jgi:hypothetical protein
MRDAAQSGDSGVPPRRPALCLSSLCMTATLQNTIAGHSAEQGLGHWFQVVEAEYREMPCLNLTKAQMRRLWGLEHALCDVLVDALVATGVLRRTSDGTYVARGSDR